MAPEKKNTDKPRCGRRGKAGNPARTECRGNGICDDDRKGHFARSVPDSLFLSDDAMETRAKEENGMETAMFGAGCFWCSEAVFESVPGVVNVVSGYAGGTTENPTYKQVCAGDTGHAEVVRIEFDPARVSYPKLLDWFWKIHDPTLSNRQGADVGTQYRSVLFTFNDAQKSAAEASRAAQRKTGGNPIVTEILPVPTFTEAEAHHQNYYRRNPAADYCLRVIGPKLRKLELSSTDSRAAIRGPGRPADRSAPFPKTG